MFDSRSWKNITFFSDGDVTVRIKGWIQVLFHDTAAMVDRTTQIRNPPKKGYTKKRGKDILFDKSNEEKKINKPR